MAIILKVVITELVFSFSESIKCWPLKKKKKPVCTMKITVP